MASSSRWTYALGLGFLTIPLACTTLLFDHYTPAKWLAFYASTLLVLGHALFRPLVLPRPPPLLAGLIATVAATYAVSMVANLPGNYGIVIVDWLAFLAIALVAFSFAGKTEALVSVILRFNLITTLAVLGYGLLQKLHTEPFPGLLHNEYPVSFLGFQNMSAEFIGLSILLQLVGLARHLQSQHDRFKTVALAFVAAASLVYLSWLDCRAVFVALAAGLVPLVGLARSKFLSRLILALAGAATLMLLMLTVPGLFGGGSSLHAIKYRNLELRLTRWGNTLHMIGTHPLGVGPGNYEFGYLPFHRSYRQDPESNEQLVVRSPHNGYLEAAAESGWLHAFALLGFLAVFLRELWRRSPREQAERELKYSVLAVTLFLAVDALFAFPMELAYPHFVAAVFFGLGLRLLAHGQVSAPRWAGFAVFGGVMALTIFYGSAFLVSKYYEANFPGNYEKTSTACAWFPANWRACMNKAQNEATRGDHAQEEKTLRAILATTPNHFPAIRALSSSVHMQQRRVEACGFIRQYDTLFDNNSSLHEHVAPVCGSP